MDLLYIYFRTCLAIMLVASCASAFTVRRDKTKVLQDSLQESSNVHEVKVNITNINEIKDDSKSPLGESKDKDHAIHEKVTLSTTDESVVVTQNTDLTALDTAVTKLADLSMFNEALTTKTIPEVPISNNEINKVTKIKTTITIVSPETQKYTTQETIDVTTNTKEPATDIETIDEVADSKTERDNAIGHPISSVIKEQEPTTIDNIITTETQTTDENSQVENKDKNNKVAGKDIKKPETYVPLLQKYRTIERKTTNLIQEQTPASLIPITNTATDPLAEADTTSAQPIDVTLKETTTENLNLNTRAENNKHQVLTSKRGGFLDSTLRNHSAGNIKEKAGGRTSEEVTNQVIGDTNQPAKYKEEKVYKNLELTTIRQDLRPIISLASYTPRPQDDEAKKDDTYTEIEHTTKQVSTLRPQDTTPIEVILTSKLLPPPPPPILVYSSSELTDDLSVKPIAKTVNYSGTANYKKMKKLDVVPAKPFVRDPDDNSWRNESLSSLGIVFKPKVSNITFTQVLKNKTETELYSSSEKEQRDQSDTPELRTRLEKLAEERKKKKKTSGESIDNDYEDSSIKATSSTSAPVTAAPEPKGTTSSSTISLTTTKNKIPHVLTTEKPKKLLNILEYFDTGDDEDYLSPIPNKNITKSTTETPSPTFTPRSKETTTVKVTSTPYPYDRKPSVQYFPPLQSTKTASINFGVDYRDDTPKEVITLKPKTTSSTYTENYHAKTTVPSLKPINLDQLKHIIPDKLSVRPQEKPKYETQELKRLYNNKQNEIGKNFYRTQTSTGAPYVDDYEKTSYIIKHLDVPKNPGLHRFVDVLKSPADIIKNKPNEESSKFDDYPVVYNNTIVHQKAPDGSRVLASSNAFFKQHFVGMTIPLKTPASTQTPPTQSTSISPLPSQSCYPYCNLTVELSPAYELHYFIDDQGKLETDNKFYKNPLRTRRQRTRAPKN